MINLVFGVQIEPFHCQPRPTRTREFSDAYSNGVSDMGRAVVEEVATLPSLALFLGMVAIWAQVIATL
jgi:hypothetical protein